MVAEIKRPRGRPRKAEVIPKQNHATIQNSHIQITEIEALGFSKYDAEFANTMLGMELAKCHIKILQQDLNNKLEALEEVKNIRCEYEKRLFFEREKISQLEHVLEEQKKNYSNFMEALAKKYGFQVSQVSE